MFCRCVMALLSQLEVRFLITLLCLCTWMVSMSWVPPPWWSTRLKKGNTFPCADESFLLSTYSYKTIFFPFRSRFSAILDEIGVGQAPWRAVSSVVSTGERNCFILQVNWQFNVETSSPLCFVLGWRVEFCCYCGLPMSSETFLRSKVTVHHESR